MHVNVCDKSNDRAFNDCHENYARNFRFFYLKRRVAKAVVFLYGL